MGYQKGSSVEVQITNERGHCEWVFGTVAKIEQCQLYIHIPGRPATWFPIHSRDIHVALPGTKSEIDDSNDEEKQHEVPPTWVNSGYEAEQRFDLPAALEQYRTFETYKVTALSPQWRFCPTEGCLHPIYHVAMGTIVTAATNHRVTCTECDVEYCGLPDHMPRFQKKGVPHQPEQPCRNVQVADPELHACIQTLLEIGSEADGSRRGDTIMCPQGCGTVITKNGGCFQMVCPRGLSGCGHIFCFYCRQPWSSCGHTYQGVRAKRDCAGWYRQGGLYWTVTEGVSRTY